MLQISNILFPTDHSACAERAFLHASFLADWHGARLHALHVAEAHRERGPMLTQSEIAEQLHQRWDEAGLARRNGGERLQLAAKQVPAVSAPQAILRYAEKEDADLIVMGTHGRRGVRRLVLGSVAEEVVRLAPCPVLTVRTGQDAAAQEARPRLVRRVLVPVDFSDFTDDAIAYGVELAQTYGARIDLLHVVEDATMPGIYYGSEPLGINTGLFRERAYDALAELAEKQIGFEDVRVAAEVGHPATRIADYAAAHEADLIVIPTHGRSGLQRMLLGSVAEKVVRLAPCPVFTVKSFGRSLLGNAEKAARAEKPAKA